LPFDKRQGLIYAVTGFGTGGLWLVEYLLQMRLIIDLHLDLSWNALSFNRDLTETIAEIDRHEAGMADHPARGHTTVSLPEMRRAGVAVCLGTLLARAKPAVRPANGFARADLDYGSQSIAYAAAQGQLAYYRLLEQQGHIQMIQTAGELANLWQRWQGASDEPIGLILSMEGADPIVNAEQAEEWYNAGLRVASLAHYGQSPYAMGTGGSGPLTVEGIKLLRAFDNLGMILDVTHLCEPSFFQALEEFDGPVLASHHNCQALVPGDRQLSDEQIKVLAGRKAVIGVALDAWMLYPGWVKGETSTSVVGLEALAKHIDYICQLTGNVSNAAIGSDLDGTFGNEQTPHDLKTIADLQKLAGILSKYGYSDKDIDDIFHGNSLRLLMRALPE